LSKIALSGNPSGTGTFTIASPNSNTDRTLNLPDAGGTIAAASSGTPSASTFLRGDGTWATVSTTPTTDQVLTATAGAEAGAVGTYAFLHINTNNTSIATGSTRAGSGLVYASIFPWVGGGTSTASGQAGSGSPAGTWRAMGQITAFDNNNFRGATLWLRIS
jgi:hypothetical protein